MRGQGQTPIPVYPFQICFRHYSFLLNSSGCGCLLDAALGLRRQLVARRLAVALPQEGALPALQRALAEVRVLARPGAQGPGFRRRGAVVVHGRIGEVDLPPDEVRVVDLCSVKDPAASGRFPMRPTLVC